MNQEKKLTSRQLQAIEMKKKIYETVVYLYQNNPYEAVTIADICETAEISTGNFYHYFKSKDDVLNEGYQIMKRQIAEKMEGVSLPPVERIYFGASLYGESMSARGYRFMSIFMLNELRQLIPYKNNFERALFSFFYEALEEAFECGDLVNGDADTLQSAIFRLVKGVTYDWCVRQGEFSLKDEILHTLDVTLAPHKPVV